MSSMVLTALQSATTVSAGDLLPIGTAVHGYGKGIKINGNNIIIKEPGYYDIMVDTSIVVTGAAAISVTLYADGVPVPGAIETATPGAAGAVVNIALPWVYKKACCCDTATLTAVVSGAGTVNTAVVKVVKI